MLWGTGNPVPMFDPYYRPGDNLYTDSLISWDPDTGKMNWYFQYLPGDMWDYDEEGTHILIDGEIDGQTHKLVTHSARNGFLYTFERTNGQTGAGQALSGQDHLDQRHRPEDRQAGRLRSRARIMQVYSGHAEPDPGGPHQEAVPVDVGRQQFLAVLLQPENQAHVHPAR